VRRAASALTIAVVDTGADLSAPDLAAKAPRAHSVVEGVDASDQDGHGTFVAALAGASSTDRTGIAGFGGDARLLIVRAVSSSGVATDEQEAAAIRYAVDEGAKIVNISLTGSATSAAEQAAVAYAASRGVLLVAAAGNDFERGNPVEYPAALLQPAGSRGVGGVGLVVGASDRFGRRASFSNTGPSLSLVAPGVDVVSAVPASSSRRDYPRVRLRGTRSGAYAMASGTSFAAPEVAGAAALVWAANPRLGARGVADLLKQTASRRARGWRPQLGWGVLDVAAAVRAAIRGQSHTVRG
jgi:subtilisin family serine protease